MLAPPPVPGTAFETAPGRWQVLSTGSGASEHPADGPVAIPQLNNKMTPNLVASNTNDELFLLILWVGYLGRAQLHVISARVMCSAAFIWGLGWMRRPEKEGPTQLVWSLQVLRRHPHRVSLESDLLYGSWLLREEAEPPGHLRAKQGTEAPLPAHSWAQASQGAAQIKGEGKLSTADSRGSRTCREDQLMWPQLPQGVSQAGMCTRPPGVLLKCGSWDFPRGPVAVPTLPTQGARVQSLVRELRSHMPHHVAKKKKCRS